MSALAGYIRRHGPANSARALSVMLQEMAARGPDDAGTVLIDTASQRSLDLSYPATPRDVSGCTPFSDAQDFSHDIAMGHRAFSLMDLSPGAHQPFWLGREICATLDGEIYNRDSLRADLASAGHQFRTRCDAETVAVAFRHWGTDCFARFAGYWGLVLYDARRKSLLIARDRVGESSLYLARNGDALYWASDINAIFRAIGSSDFPTRQQAVSDFISFGYRDLDNSTFYQGISTFPQASFAWIDGDGQFTPQIYWKIPPKRLRESDLSVTDAAAKVRELLAETVQCRLKADVPVAFELSGGMDSSALVAANALNGNSRISAYSIAFPGVEEDELPYARIVAERYKDSMDLHVIEQPVADFFDAADEYVVSMAEPFHSPNMLTNQRIWKAMAQRGVRASINGTAGDELFASDLLPHLAWLIKRGSLVRLHRETMKSSEMETGAFDEMYRWRIKRAVKLIGQQLFSPIALRQKQKRTHQRLANWGLNLPQAPVPRPFFDGHDSLLEEMTGWQMNYWMRSGNQSASTVPMDIRMPFLDHRLVDFAFTLPMGYLLRDGWNKWILRIAMQDLLPKEIVWRKQKMGFPFPYKSWFAASRATVAALLSDLDCPYINGEQVMNSYETIGTADHKLLWRVISLALWWKKCVLGQSLKHYSREPVTV